MAKKPNQKKDFGLNTSPQETERITKSVSTIANNKIEESLKDFSKLSEKERTDLFGSKEFLEQFWDFFKEQHPNLLDEIDSQEKLTIYVQNLEKKGFSIRKIIDNNKEFHKEFKETQDEKGTIEKSLNEFKKYCDGSENKMPNNIFDDFAKDIGLETKPKIAILKTTKLSKIGNLFSTRKKFLEDKGIKLKDHQSSEAEKILCPPYLPTERLLISAAIKKIKKNLPNGLTPAFEASFPLPIDIHSSFENLKDFKQQWTIFLDGHRGQIDENLAKNLDKIIISNGDIYQELQYEGEDIEWTKGFSEQTKNFRRMFNQLATRQLFDEAKEKGTYLEYHLEQIGKEFKNFPPYINELFNLYPYRHKEVIDSNADFKAKYEAQANILKESESVLNGPKPENQKDKSIEQRREECRKKVLKAKSELNTIKRNGYAKYISNKNPELGNIVENLVNNDFDINKLSKPAQQKITNILVENKLGDSIKNQIPNILGLDPNEYKTFVKDLFDLDKKDIIIPTQYGNIPINFLEKSFFGGPIKEGVEIDISGNLISEQQNLPLNLKIQLTEENQDFFQENIIFGDLFSTFHSRKGPIKLNDSYEVSIKNKDGISKKGYLSEYPPSEEIEQEIQSNRLEKGWYLYSHPITKSEDARTIMTRDGDPKGNPIVIPEKSESEYEIDIISKELNLNGEAIGGLLFSHVLGQYNIKNDLSANQEKSIAKKFGKIENVYKDTNDMLDSSEKDEKSSEKKEESVEDLKEKEYQEFLQERSSLKGYQEKPNLKDEKSDYGFKNGAKILIQMVESNFLPSGSYIYANAEIKNIDKNKGTFQITYKGNEVPLGKYEGLTETHKLTKQSLQKFKERFEESRMHKLPNKDISKDINQLIPTLQDIAIDGVQPNQSFKGVHRNGNKFMIDIGKEEGQEVTHFGVIETLPGEDSGKESKTGYMYEIKHNPANNSFKLTANDIKGTTINLDYPNFILFVSSRKLQPKTEKSSKGIEPVANSGPIAEDAKKGKYSIASLIGLFKNFKKKIGDGLKKYEEEQIEDLTESMFYQGKLFNKLASIMPTKKMKEAFGNAGEEYMQERDNKIWKKIEKYQKFYESDPDFGGDYMRGTKIKPFLEGKKPFKDPQQAAAMLLSTVKKGKGPYSRNTDRAGKGKWIRILFGEGHQKRYLLMKEKLQRELDQGYNTHGQIWADDLQNEILQLEMKYITHCIDGKQLANRDDVPKLEATFSKKFAGELEGESNKFFSESVSGSSKEKSYSFELARFEYFRLLGDRPQQAIPCLKQIAAKAVTPMQWKVFESAVLTGMLSGVFYNITQADKSFIQKICRTIGFLPGMWIRDPNHHQKVQQFIKIATGEKPKYEIEKSKDNWVVTDYKVGDHGFGKGPDIKGFKASTSYDHGLNKRLLENNRLKQISDFAAMSGKNYQDKTIIELINDPQTPKEEKQILSEIEARSLEQLEGVDPDVKMNGYGLEQNILAKNQSLIDEITDFSEGKFKGRDKDEIQGIQTAWKEIGKKVPKTKIEDKNQIIYILKKFMNWFEGRGFNTDEKRFLIRALLTVQNEIKYGNKQSADEILWYMIVGNIVRNSGNGQAPDELINGLEAFKDFFKSNIDNILQPDTIEKSFGNLVVDELHKGPFKVAPWDEYSDLEENKVFFGLTTEERKKRGEMQKKYNIDQLYINKRLYRSAQQIEQRNHIPNKFKGHLEQKSQKTTTEKLHETLNPKDVRIKNAEIIEKTKRKLSGQLSNEDMTDEEIMAMNENMYNDGFGMNF